MRYPLFGLAVFAFFLWDVGMNDRQYTDRTIELVLEASSYLG